MNQEQLDKVKQGHGFIAALDQSGGSTPKALKAYGVDESQYSNEDEMFDLVHDMRTRIVTSPSFTSDKVLGAILFEQTMDRRVDGEYTGNYLANKGIVPFLKVDKGLADEENGVQLMKPIPDLDKLLNRANDHKIFGTKMRSNILEFNPNFLLIAKALLLPGIPIRSLYVGFKLFKSNSKLAFLKPSFTNA